MMMPNMVSLGLLLQVVEIPMTKEDVSCCDARLFFDMAMTRKGTFGCLGMFISYQNGA